MGFNFDVYPDVSSKFLDMRNITLYSVWAISANVDKYFRLFPTHSFTNSKPNKGRSRDQGQKILWAIDKKSTQRTAFQVSN